MQNRWNDATAQACGDDPLQLRVYTSRLLGRESALVLHGGGNTSVKAVTRTFLGEEVEVVYVKGSGHDLATIGPEGFAPVRRGVLLRLAEMDDLTDTEIVREQRAGMLDPYAPSPSVEAILHGIIPFKYVDHTHSDAVLTLTNTPRGEAYIRELYSDDVLVIPYVMAGFKLAKAAYHAIQGVDWSALRAIILLNHGLITFADDARQSYETMIAMVSEAEDFLRAHGAYEAVARVDSPATPDPLAVARLRKAVSDAAGKPMIARVAATAESQGFAARPEAPQWVSRGPLTPDHVSRAKRTPMICTGDPRADVARFVADYEAYFKRYAEPHHVMLDPAPRWALWPGVGTVAFGHTLKMAGVNADIVAHTLPAIQGSAALGGYQVPSEDHFFDIEYWELQQAKHKRSGAEPPLTGQIALVAGADQPVGRACAEALAAHGAAVVALGDDLDLPDAWQGTGKLGLTCDLSDATALDAALGVAVLTFGGLDIVVSAERAVFARALPYLREGVDPVAIVLCAPEDTESILPQAEGLRRGAIRLPDRLDTPDATPGVAAAICAVASGALAAAQDVTVTLRG
jgi:rhamnose utilization protein RhaD (predicted bifunctional aldolase and dehydrogenase)